ncbi:hypothetical protein PT2222_140383 [Paraburkholderia tropica]
MTLKNQFMKRDYLIKMILNAMVKQPTFIKWTITSNCFRLIFLKILLLSMNILIVLHL